VHTPGLIVIAGPTATGKSSLAIALAKRLNSVILNADSRACYQEFDIGTAKPSKQEQQHVPHYLLDIASPYKTLTVADYQTQACEWIKKFHANGITPLLVGGTGLYIKAITNGLIIPRVPPQPELRSQLSTYPQAQCYAFLQQVDPASAARVHPHDQVRTLRALEVYYTTGKPLSALQGESPPNYPIVWIGLDCAVPDQLSDRIQRRTRSMIETGLVDEVVQLGAKYGWDLPLLSTLGYQEMVQYHLGHMSLTEAEELICLHTRQFAKRQRTWFRAVNAITWFDADAIDVLENVWQTLHSLDSSH
jgi:tRNA dimethylallyltransferase